ncbi:MAG TPA: hypothetical protein VGZ48_11570 [Candidatus Acidoferrales bacterium]|nr:hypothetical protein [Candidatus Acidoferrales bacterium]
MGIGTHSSVQAGGQAFDVETETRSTGAPAHIVIDTTVYVRGRVMYRRVTGFEDAAAVDPAAALHDRVQAQHRSVVDDLRSGVLKFETPGSSTHSIASQAPIEFPKGIEVRLVNASSWLVLGTASLNIEVRGRATNKPAAGVTIEVVLEGAEPPFRLQAGSDPQGRVSLVFPMPKLGAAGAELVIRASGVAGRDEVRYRLKPKVASAKKAQSQ